MRTRALLILLICILSNSVWAKSPEQVKAAFLFQMSKFVEFNPKTKSQAITFCFYNLELGIGKVLKGNSSLKINEKPIEVVLINKNQQTSELYSFCDITYIDETLENDIIPLWIDTTSSDTLTVGESISFLEKGGIAALVQEGNRIRLYINKQQLLSSNFKVQSRLLAVSKFHPN